MSIIHFPVRHPEIRCGNQSCRNLLNALVKVDKEFIGVCQVRVLPPSDVFVPCLGYKIDGKLMFSLCGLFAIDRKIQKKPCEHDADERSWIDVYISIDIKHALKVGYKILEYKEIWHYHRGGERLFRDLILNIVRRRIECSVSPLNCESQASKDDYVQKIMRRMWYYYECSRYKEGPCWQILK